MISDLRHLPPRDSFALLDDAEAFCGLVALAILLLVWP